MKPRFNYFKSPDNESQKGLHILFYCEWGDPSSKDVAICVHGLSRNSRDFDYLAEALSDKYRVICIDVVGRGKSEWLSDKSQYDYETYITDAVKLIDHLGIKKFDWIGTSMGGIMGMIIAARYPHMIRNLVLNDIGPVIPGMAIERIINNVTSTHEFHNQLDAERTFRERMATFGIKNEEHWRHLIKHSIIKKLNGKYSFTYDPHIVPTPKLISKIRGIIGKLLHIVKKSSFPDVNLMDIWEKVTCPVMVLRGNHSDVLTTDIAAEMARNNNNITIVEFAGIGHAPMLMENDQISVVRNWLLDKKELS
jgi:pimeloyl-ACP methyl ester carboxylesterase